MMTTRQILLHTFAALLLTACATTPKFDTSDVNLGITLQQATLENSTLKGTRLLWGGVIIASSNTKETTQFEILAYPLDDDQKPELDKTPLGRFIAVREGYLETRDYSQGRLMTLRGTLLENRIGKIGESEYIYPVIDIDNHYLWPIRRDSSEPQFHFGIGVMLHN
jgi:outer membrane lipoprotein